MYNLFWSIKVVPSTQHFARRAMLNMVATKVNLRRRGSPLVEISCALCGLEEETVTHLFLTCSITNMVLNLCNKWVGISPVHHNQLNVHFQPFSLLVLNNKRNNLWTGL